MSEPTTEQLCEVFRQIREKRVDGWALQGLIESASKIAFEQILKKIIKNATQNTLDGQHDYFEELMTNIAVASITKDASSVRASVVYFCWPIGKKIILKALVEVASITHEPRDINLVLKAITDGDLSGYYLIKAYLTIAEATDNQEYVSLAQAEAEKNTETDLILQTKIWTAISSPKADDQLRIISKKAEKILDGRGSRNTFFRVEALMPGAVDYIEKSLRDSVLRGGVRPKDSLHEIFAAFAATTHDPFDLESAYNATREIERKDPIEGRKAWRSIVRIIAGID